MASDQHPFVTELFGELYFRENYSSSTLDFLFPTSPQISSPTYPSSLPQETRGLKRKSNCEKAKIDILKNCMEGEGCLYSKKPSSKDKRKLFPPPISCLKLYKFSKSFGYLNFDEDRELCLYEEFRVPSHGSLLHAARENGCLRLNFPALQRIGGAKWEER